MGTAGFMVSSWVRDSRVPGARMMMLPGSTPLTGDALPGDLDGHGPDEAVHAGLRCAVVAGTGYHHLRAQIDEITTMRP